jgi:hypothetical protein
MANIIEEIKADITKFENMNLDAKLADFEKRLSQIEIVLKMAQTAIPIVAAAL